MSRFPPWYAPGQHAAIAAPAGWDRLVLGGLELRAWAQMAGGDGPALKIDPRKKAGATAAHPTTHGLDAWEFAFRVACVEQAQLDDVDTTWRALFSIDNPRPVSVDHPALYSIAAALGTVNAIVKNLPAWAPSSAIPRAREATMKFLYWPAAAKGAKTTQSKTPVRAVQNKLTAPAAGVGTVLAPTSSPDYAKPTWP